MTDDSRFITKKKRVLTLGFVDYFFLSFFIDDCKLQWHDRKRFLLYKWQCNRKSVCEKPEACCWKLITCYWWRLLNFFFFSSPLSVYKFKVIYNGMKKREDRMRKSNSEKSVFTYSLLKGTKENVLAIYYRIYFFDLFIYIFV